MQTTSKIDKFKSGIKKASVVAGGVLTASGALAKGLVEQGRAARDTNGKISSLTERLGTYGKDHQKVADRIVKNAESMLEEVPALTTKRSNPLKPCCSVSTDSPSSRR